jgi:hypothetical protein
LSRSVTAAPGFTKSFFGIIEKLFVVPNWYDVFGVGFVIRRSGLLKTSGALIEGMSEFGGATVAVGGGVVFLGAIGNLAGGIALNLELNSL